MTKAELESLIEDRNITNMTECKKTLSDMGTPKSMAQIIQIIASEEIQKVNNILGDDLAYDIQEIVQVLKNYSPSTAVRQKNDLRSGKQIWGPRPNSLEKHVKAYYPVQEVAAVMYIQSHVACMYGKPSLKKILESRHD